MQGLTSTASFPPIGIPPWLLRPWAAVAILAAVCCIAVLAGLGVNRMIAAPDSAPAASQKPDLADRSSAILQTYTADNLRAVDAETAIAMNRRQAVVPIPNPAAAAFAGGFSSPSDRSRSIKCMTDAIYYEAANEPAEGQRAVAQVILNRVRNIAYPDTVCGVIYQGASRRTGCQFSFTCDGSLLRPPSRASWQRAQRIAEAAIGGSVMAKVGHSMHYHANYVVPYWSSSLIKTGVIGAHIFYSSPGAAGHRSAFTARYAGTEPAIQPLVAAPIAPQDSPAAEDLTISAEATDPKVGDVSEGRARMLDQFGLLQYKSPRGDGAQPTNREPRLETALGAAMAGQSGANGGRSVDRP